MDDLGTEEGLDAFSASTKVALIDADTIAFAACITAEYPDDLLSHEMYTHDEWEEIINDTNYDEVESCIWRLDYDKAMKASTDRIDDIILATDTCKAELYFTTGLNFRHTVDNLYKANRKKTRYPAGLKRVKEGLRKLYDGEICEGYEADDIVVALKEEQPEHYVLCAVDKDVYKSTPGSHYNYYYSERYNISPKWVTVSKPDAMKFHPLQTLCGDPTDNIKGCPSIGPKKAEKALANCKTLFEMWMVVSDLFSSKGITHERMMQDARLTGMHQLERCADGWCWSPFSLPTPDGVE